MSLFPQVGSKVIKVLTNKTETAAKIVFDDGNSIYVRYDALILDRKNPPLKESVHRPIPTPRNSLVNRQTRRLPPKVTPAKVMTEADYKAAAQMVLSKQSSRQDKIFEQWEKDTGQVQKE